MTVSPLRRDSEALILAVGLHGVAAAFTPDARALLRRCRQQDANLFRETAYELRDRGVDLAELLRDAPNGSNGAHSAPVASLAEHQRSSKVRTSWRDGMITARELCGMSFKPLKYIVPGILPEGLTILASRPKLGKSWLTLLIGTAVANGVEALAQDYGLTPPAKGSVLLLALEDGKRRLQRRMTKILNSSRSDNWPEQLHLKTEWRRLDQGGLEDIRAWYDAEKAAARNPLLVVIDTLAKVRAPGNSKQSPYQNDHDALAALQKLAEELGLAVVVNHHDRKMDADDVFDTVSGTLGLTGAVDTILILTKKGQERTLHIRGRDIEEEMSLALDFDQTSCRWRIVGTAAERQERAQSAERTKVLEVLQEHTEPMAIADIMVATGMDNRRAVDLLLFKMTAADQIKRVSRGLYCHPDHISKDHGKIGKKERMDSQASEIKEETGNLSNLSDLSVGLKAEGNSPVEMPDLPACLDRRPPKAAQPSYLTPDDEQFIASGGLR